MSPVPGYAHRSKTLADRGNELAAQGPAASVLVIDSGEAFADKLGLSAPSLHFSQLPGSKLPLGIGAQFPGGGTRTPVLSRNGPMHFLPGQFFTIPDEFLAPVFLRGVPATSANFLEVTIRDLELVDPIRPESLAQASRPALALQKEKFPHPHHAGWCLVLLKCKTISEVASKRLAPHSPASIQDFEAILLDFSLEKLKSAYITAQCRKTPQILPIATILVRFHDLQPATPSESCG